MPRRPKEKSIKWSWKLGRVAGIDVYLHATFVLLIVWVLLAYVLQGRGLASALAGAAFILLLFLCVLLHEFGHALTARRFGIATRDITLLPIGGLARLERIPEDPRQELWVALAGPAVNLVIAAALFAGLLAGGALELPSAPTWIAGSLLGRLMAINLLLALFNLLPAFPMDGGRVLRALLARRMDYAKATRAAASVGQAMAFMMGFAGLLWNPFLVFVALFVWVGATQEAEVVRTARALKGVPVRFAMVTDYRTLEPQDPLSRAVDLILSGSQQDFPVLEEGRLVGMLTRADLLAELDRRGQAALVGQVMQREFQSVDTSETLEAVLTRLRQCRCQTIPVVREGSLAGIVTADNLNEFMLIRAALKGDTSQTMAA